MIEDLVTFYGGVGQFVGGGAPYLEGGPLISFVTVQQRLFKSCGGMVVGEWGGGGRFGLPFLMQCGGLDGLSGTIESFGEKACLCRISGTQ